MICFSSVTENVELPVGGLADYSPRIHAKALQPDKVFALRVRLDYTGKIC